MQQTRSNHNNLIHSQIASRYPLSTHITSTIGRYRVCRSRRTIGLDVSLHEHFGSSKQDRVHTAQKAKSKQEELPQIVLSNPTIPAIGRMIHEIFHPHFPEILFRMARAMKNLITVPHNAAFIPAAANDASGV